MAQQKKGLITRLLEGKEKSEEYARSTLPTNRWQLFWDIFKGNFGKIVKVNLLMLIFCLPMAIVLVISLMYSESVGVTYPFGSNLGIGYPAMPAMQGVSEWLNLQGDLFMYIGVFLTAILAAVGLAGGMYVIRNMVWTEGIFVANDFWYGIKKNFKQFILIMLVYSIVFYLSNLLISICDRTLVTRPDNEWIYVVSKVFTYIVLITFSVMTLHMLSMSATYTLKYRQLLKNSFIFAFALLPNNAFFIALGIIPFLVMMLGGILMLIGIALVFVFGFSVFLLIWVNYSQWTYDKFINDRVKGAKKNRGIYKKVSESDSGALRKYREQLAMAEQTALNSRPVKPITDDELTIAELPTSFSRDDIRKLEESKQAIYDDHAKYVEEHQNKDKHAFTEQDLELEKIRKEREQRIQKAKKELAKRNKK